MTNWLLKRFIKKAQKGLDEAKANPQDTKNKDALAKGLLSLEPDMIIWKDDAQTIRHTHETLMQESTETLIQLYQEALDYLTNNKYPKQ